MKKSTERSKTSAEDGQEKIRRRAYELWELSSREHGHDAEHWAQAEQEARLQNDQQGG